MEFEPKFKNFFIDENAFGNIVCEITAILSRGRSANTWINHSQHISMMTSSNGNISALLAICAGHSPVTGEFPAQRPVTRSFGVFFNLCLNKRLSKQWGGLWFETPSHPLWHHCNVLDHQIEAFYLLHISGILSTTKLIYFCKRYKSHLSELFTGFQSLLSYLTFLVFSVLINALRQPDSKGYWKFLYVMGVCKYLCLMCEILM